MFLKNFILLNSKLGDGQDDFSGLVSSFKLPQLFNVLKGEMSIVGPRPERPFFVKQFIAQKPEYDYRHNVKPGITGLAQIAGKYNTSAYDKLIYDLLYIQDVSVKTDLMIMLQTFKVLLTKSSTEGVKGK